MPLLFNLDHQHAIHQDGSATAPGESHEFTEEEIEAGLAGHWSENDPRAGLKAEREFKKRRDSRATASSPSPDEQTPDVGDSTDPAETGENKE